MSTEYREIPLEKIRESKQNPRHEVDLAQLKELTASVGKHGVLVPIFVRPVNDHFEIVAGAMRYRAAKAAKLAAVRAVVKKLDDREAFEIAMIENLQRQDLNPMDEAQGYAWLTKHGQSAAQIAEAVKRSEAHVYDRLKLLSLIAPLRDSLRKGELPVAHAVLLARTEQNEQKELMNDLFRADAKLAFETDDSKARKVISLRELTNLIERKTRFDKPDAFLFKETAQAIEQAQKAETKIVPITRAFNLHPTAKRENVRTFTVRSWRPASGKVEQHGEFDKAVKAPTCESSVLGVFVAGPGQGNTMRVCVNRDCAVHFPKPKKTKATESAAQQKQKAKDQEAEWKRKNEEARALHELRDKVLNELLKPGLEKLRTMPFKKNGVHVSLILPDSNDKRKFKGETSGDFVQFLAENRLTDLAKWGGQWPYIAGVFKALGLDPDAIVKERMKAAKPKEETVKEKKGKAKASKGKEPKAKVKAKKAKVKPEPEPEPEPQPEPEGEEQEAGS